MIAIGVGGVDERAIKLFTHPAVDDAIALMRFIFVSVSPPPFIKRPGVLKFVTKRPRTGKVLRFQIFFLEGREVSPVAVFVSKSGDVGVGAHTGAGQKQHPPGVCQKLRRLF